MMLQLFPRPFTIPLRGEQVLAEDIAQLAQPVLNSR